MPRVSPSGGAWMTPRLEMDIPIEEMEEEAEAEIERVMWELAAYVEQSFVTKAKEYLNTTAEAYAEGVRVNKQDTRIEVSLEGTLPNMLEHGTDRFDMKPGLLKGRLHRVIPMHDGGFRTVKRDSPPMSWWHPGFEAINLADLVREEVEPVAEEAFAEIRNRFKV